MMVIRYCTPKVAYFFNSIMHTAAYLSAGIFTYG